VIAGARAGYIFQIGDFGVGYYKDNPPVVMVTAESLEQEQLELRVKVRLLRMHDACPSAPDAHVRVSAGGKDHSDARVCGFGPSYMTSREACTANVCEKSLSLAMGQFAFTLHNRASPCSSPAGYG